MTTHFDPGSDLIVVRSTVWGPGGQADLSFAVDTAATKSVVASHVADELGYHPRRDGIAITTVRSAIGKEQGYTLKVAKFAGPGVQ